MAEERNEDYSKNDDAKIITGHYIMDGIPKFTGDELTYSSTKWVQDIDDNAEIFGWTGQQKLIIARRSLAGTAQLWLRTEKVFKTYDELKTALQKEFPEAINVKQMHEMMSARKKRADETYYQYMLIMKELGRRAKFPDYVAIQYIIDGISDFESNKLLFYGVTTYPVLKEKITLYEAFKQKTKKQDATRRDSRPKPAKVIYPVTSKVQPRCYKCGECGHLSSNCTRGVKCFRCNSYGHIGAECKRSSSAEVSHPSTSGTKTERKSMFVHGFDRTTLGGADAANEASRISDDRMTNRETSMSTNDADRMMTRETSMSTSTSDYSSGTSLIQCQDRRSVMNINNGDVFHNKSIKNAKLCGHEISKERKCLS
ncbi:uncharacterized protein LOC135077252 [Ostrinia nubilalis]|uniref:uncharacterized protein LOC135077252 n=1 Tax=Ostrinia nubilalis TaxID=29057 RepID=UPI0030824D4C